MLLKQAKMKCPHVEFGFSYSKPEEFTRCMWQRAEKVLLVWVIYRAVIALYWTLTLLHIMFTFTDDKKGENPLKFLIFLTFWCNIIQAFYLILALVIVIIRYLKERKHAVEEILPMESMPWHYKVLWMAYDVSLPSTPAICIVFWLMIYNTKEFPDMYKNLSGHLINAIITLVDFFLVATPLRFTHFYICFILGSTYAVFSYFYYLAGGRGVREKLLIYDILDWRSFGKATLTCVGCTLLLTVLFLLLVFLQKGKAWLWTRKLKRADIESA